MPQESRRRSIAKAVTWRVVALIITVGTAWVITRSVDLAVAVGIADTAVKVGSYYLHERAWNAFSFGRVQPRNFVKEG